MFTKETGWMFQEITVMIFSSIVRSLHFWIKDCKILGSRNTKFHLLHNVFQERIQKFFCNECLIEYWMIKCNLRDGVMLGAKINGSLHLDSHREKSAKILFHILYSLLTMKNTATSTCVLTARILTVGFL